MSEGDILVRRSITLEAIDRTRVQAWVADNFHHFGVTLAHDLAHVTGVQAQSVRFPWTTCPGASAPLRELVGAKLSARPSDLALRYPMARNCTHLFELAALAGAQALRGGACRYDATASAGPEDILNGTLCRDGDAVLHISTADDAIITPHHWEGRHLYQGFRAWTDGMSDTMAEQLWVLRRILWLARGLAQFRPTAFAAQSGLGPVCHSFQPEQRSSARGIPASRIDVTGGQDLLGEPVIKKQ